MKQPLLLPTNTAPIIYRLFPKSGLEEAIHFQKSAFSQCLFSISSFFDLTFFIVKKAIFFPTNTAPIIYCSFRKNLIWNRALLSQNSAFPTCMKFSGFHCEEIFTLPNKHYPCNRLSFSKKPGL